MKQSGILIAAMALIFAGCGTALKDAGNFSPNIAPEIDSMTPARYDGKAIDTANILPDSYYTIAVAAHDPDGQTLSWDFSSDYGTFSTPDLTADGCSVLFVTDMPKGSTAVDITLKATDPKGAAATKTITLGYGKAAPELTVSSSSLTVSSTTSAPGDSFTVKADCDGTFHMYCDNSLGSANDAHFSTSKDFCVFGYTSGSAAETVTIYGYNAAAAGFKVRLPSAEAGQYKVWVVFKDLLEQETVSLCTVTEY